MESVILRINEQLAACPCGHAHRPVRMHGVLEHGAIGNVAPYIAQAGWRQVLIAADGHTWEAAGQALNDHLQAHGIRVDICQFAENERGDVMADAASILHLMLHVSERTEAIIACGSGTIHDIVRFVTAKTGKPFLSVPTSASVDGFTSAGAPLIIAGVKRTIQTKAPEAIFADLDVLAVAPLSLTAAGLGDMLGKFTSLADWQVSRDMAGEPFCPAAYELTKEALERCVAAVDQIAAGGEQGIRQLMEALLISGWSMLAIEHSRPASGGEHHLSHIWEMQSIRQGLQQQLHGAKVGVATVLLSGLYKRLAGLTTAHEAFRVYESLPDSGELAALLDKLGAPVTPGQLGISAERVLEALRQGPDLRERATGLRYIRDHHPEWFEEVAYGE